MPLFLGSQLMNTLTSVPRPAQAAPGRGLGLRGQAIETRSHRGCVGREESAGRRGRGGRGTRRTFEIISIDSRGRAGAGRRGGRRGGGRVAGRAPPRATPESKRNKGRAERCQEAGARGAASTDAPGRAPGSGGRDAGHVPWRG